MTSLKDENKDMEDPNRMADPVCGLSHRFPAGQYELFDQDHKFLCCDSRDCPYKKIHHKHKYCLFRDDAGDL